MGANMMTVVTEKIEGESREKTEKWLMQSQQRKQ